MDEVLREVVGAPRQVTGDKGPRDLANAVWVEWGR